jgi:dihydroorotase-like cyclic amidohydrolase
LVLTGVVAAAAAGFTTTIVQCEEQPPQELPVPTELEVEPDTSYENEPVMEQILAQERLPVGDKKKAAPKKSWFSSKKSAAKDYELPADAYENLPDHDEETDCLLCRTHAMSPCGKFEHCVKDRC